MKTMLNSYLKPLPILGLCAALAAAGLVVAFENTPDTKPALNIPLNETPIQRAGGTYTSFAPIVKKVAPAVVKVVVTIQAPKAQTQQFPGFDDPFWRHFFGQPMGPQEQLPSPRE